MCRVEPFGPLDPQPWQPVPPLWIGPAPMQPLINPELLRQLEELGRSLNPMPSIKVILGSSPTGNPTLEFIGLPAAKAQAVGTLAQLLTMAGADGKYEIHEVFGIALAVQQIAAK